MAFPDLTYARFAMERLMADECLITRDPQGVADDTWNPATMTYSVVDPDDIVVYGATSRGDRNRSLKGDTGVGGKCKLSPVQSRSDLPREEGGRPEITRQYYATLPWDAPQVRPGDLFQVVASARDPHAIGITFVIMNEQVKTLLVGRTVTLEEVTDAFVGVRGS